MRVPEASANSRVGFCSAPCTPRAVRAGSDRAQNHALRGGSPPRSIRRSSRCRRFWTRPRVERLTAFDGSAWSGIVKLRSNPLPIHHPRPAEWRCKTPGGSVATRADSRSLGGASPRLFNSPCTRAPSLQLSFEAIRGVPLSPCKWEHRSQCRRSAIGWPFDAFNDGPSARMTTVFGALPVIMKPAITKIIAVRFDARAGGEIEQRRGGGKGHYLQKFVRSRPPCRRRHKFRRRRPCRTR